MVRRIIALIAVAAVVAAACGTDEGSETPVTTLPGTDGPVSGFVGSDLDRIDPTITPADLDAVAAAEQAFAISVYRALSESGGDLVFSPVSVHIALAMAVAGAEGRTADEMAAVLGVDGIDGDRLHDALNALDRLLESYNRDEGEGPGGIPQRVELSVVNALWGQAGFAFEQPFLDLLATSYGAGMHVVDFVAAADAARREINAWVADRTNDRIRDLIGEGALNALTRLVITNAVYLDATWLEPFDPAATSPGPFTLLDGSVTTVPMMHGDRVIPYASGDGWQAVELPYTGGELGMLLIVPDSGRFTEFEASLSVEVLDEITGALGFRDVVLSLPTFTARNQIGLSSILRGLGMEAAFDPSAADFSGITAEERLVISEVIHEAFIAVDEAGTEAAAATAVVMRATAAPVDQVPLHIDRPFLFALRDRHTGTLLFVGRILEPSPPAQS